MFDRFGKEIYEGDILQRNEETWGVIIYASGYKKSILADWTNNWKYTNWEIIGNIREMKKKVKKC